jgi:hypothetical protein
VKGGLLKYLNNFEIFVFGVLLSLETPTNERTHLKFHGTPTWSSTVAYKEILKIISNYWGSIVGGVLLSFEFYGRHTKVNCVLDLGCQRCPIDDMGVVVFM